MPRPAKDETERLIPSSARLTPLQHARMQRLSKRDGLPLPEHQRRAFDVYCGLVEKQHGLPPLTVDDIGG